MSAEDRRARFGAVGAGFWARRQLAAWNEVPGAACVALCDRDRARAEAVAHELGIPAVYTDAADMLSRESLAFVDVITTEESHAPLVQLAARHGRPVICQKPMAPTLELCRAMVGACAEAGVPFAVHENFRFQTPMRALKRALDEGRVGAPYRARIQMTTGYPVFQNQPNLRELERFVLTDIGSHVLDLARFFFGEGERLFATTSRVSAGIKGEDAATVTIKMKSGATVVCEMALAGTPLEHDCFPETLVFIEAERGSLELAPGFWVRETTAAGTTARRHPPPRYPWADPDYLVAQASMVACNEDLLAAMTGRRPAETRGDDNLRTMEMVFGAYESARTGEVWRLPS
jgi:predicted dehydrogenase